MTNSFYEKSALDTSTSAGQILAADGYVSFVTNNVLDGCSIAHEVGDDTVRLLKRGLYQVSFNGDIEPTAAGDIALQLVNNGGDIGGAVATVTGAAGDTYSVAFTALVKVLPSCCAVHNTGNLKVQISAAGTVTNAHIVVVKLA